jgi:hypothetical protein
MIFQVENFLKSNYNHTFKYRFKVIQYSLVIILVQSMMVGIFFFYKCYIILNG